MARDLLLVFHILLLVAWLGIDVGVFYSSFVMRRPGLDTQSRQQVRHVMVTLDLAPRLSLILMIPVGLGLAYTTGLGFSEADDTLVASVLWLVAAVAVTWAVLTVWAFRARQISPGSPSLTWFDRADWLGRVLVAAVFLAIGIWSLVGEGPLGPVWLSWKATLFGMIVAAGLWIRVAARRYRGPLTVLLREGETSDRLAAVNRSIRGVYPAVLAVWTGLVVMVVLSVVRP